MERLGTRSVEWRTLALILLCTAAWLAFGFAWPSEMFWIVPPAMALLVAFHTSLQHETIHDHPTPWAWLNELLVSLPFGLIFPYRRYRALHLQHHLDQNLTDPLEDPESYFWPLNHYERMRPIMRSVFRFNNTFFGRLAIGPLLSIIGFGRTEFARIIADEAGVRKAWALHIFGLVLVCWIVTQLFAMPLWIYVLTVAYPAASITAMRSYAEHQAAENIGGRTAIVESNAFMALLYLNNNLHIVHHAHPKVPWYDIPELYRERKTQYLAANGNLLFKGYGEIARRFGLTTKQTVDHPYLYRGETTAE